MMRLFAASLILALVAGCAHKDGGNNGTRTTGSGSTSESDLKDIASFRLSDPEGPKVVDQELESIPTEVNPLVEKWIAYFQGRGRPHMERYLARSTRYEKLMKKVLRDNGLPEDLFYIALIESGFSAKATSHAAAVGYWQFIRGTGKRYGLEINSFIDERRDPVFATQAAAEYFKGLYSVFGSWYLAMASYNVGENRVKREVMNHYTRDFWELARKKRFPAETINYVPKFIAAKMIGKDPAKYGFDEIDYLPPIEFDHVTVKTAVNLRQMAEKMNINYEDFKALNPKFRGEVAPLRSTELTLRVPPGMTESATVAALESVVQNVQFVADSGETQTYRIRPGDNLSSIAKRYRTTVAYLRDINNLPRKQPLRVGMRLQVPDRTPLKSRPAAAAPSRQVAKSKAQSPAVGQKVATPDGRYYIVQSGDSLFSIAKKYNTTVAELQKINSIRRGRVLKVGMKLKVPGMDSTATRATSKAKVHVVRRGENLSLIAAKYKVTTADLKANNKLRNPSSLAVGERIVIPSEN
ncbi:membrane-bound lytic murein transglycosylase D precursor [Bdellovibrio bacteriovorus W]|nr:membrane-bound lytic murein transglycosylase D precursor [Bdellovibrio bacteriovorus W]